MDPFDREEVERRRSASGGEFRYAAGGRPPLSPPPALEAELKVLTDGVRRLWPYCCCC